METMTISDARASLADVVDQVRVSREPVYLTRRSKPIAVLVDVARMESLLEIEASVGADDEHRARDDRQRRAEALTASAATFASWFDPAIPYPASVSDLYAARPVEV